MAGRIRTIKPEILEDAKAAGLSDAAWRLWVSMWLIADDHGNLRGDSRRLAADVFWAAASPPNMVELLAELVRAGFIRQYTVRGQDYVSIVNWAKHQRVDNAGKARVPGPGEADAAETLGEPPRDSANDGESRLDHDHDQRSTTASPDARARVEEPAPRSENMADRWVRLTGKQGGVGELLAAQRLCEDAYRSQAPAMLLGDFIDAHIVAFKAWLADCPPDKRPAASPGAMVRNFVAVQEWFAGERGPRVAKPAPAKPNRPPLVSDLPGYRKGSA